MTGRDISPAALVFAGIAAGLAAGVKLSFLAPVAALMVGVIVIAPGASRLRAALAFGVPMLVAGGYWYLRNLIAVGNPIPYIESLGPISLPAPARDFQLRPDYAVVHYWNDTGVWSHWFAPGLHESFGTLWPAILIGMLAGAVFAIWRGREPILRVLGAFVIVTTVAYVFTPLTAAGEPGEPISFTWNVRYLAPAIAVGLALLPCLPAARATARRQVAVLAGLVIVLAFTVASLVQWHQGHVKGAVAAGVLVVLAAAALALVHRRGWLAAGRGRWIGAAVGAALAVALVAAGYWGQRHYLKDRFENTGQSQDLDAALRWANDLRDAKVAVAGIRGVFTQYPFYGTDLSNEVQWLGRREAHDGYSRIPDCRRWREAINAGGYTHVVTTFDPYLPGTMRNSPEGRWTGSDPNAHLVLREGPVRVFELRGPLDPSRCAGQKPLRPAQLHSVPNLNSTLPGGDQALAMLGVYASAAAILIASLVLGRALLHVVGLSVHTWLGGVVGFAALTILCPLLIRLPGRGTTVSVLLALIILAALFYLWREDRGGRLLARRSSSDSRDRDRGGPRPPGEGHPQSSWALGVLVALIVVVAASLPFAFNERDGVLGEGIYTNDQAAQLYWTDWLQHGIGPEPNAVRFGYPTGPQSVAATAAEATNTNLLDAFNGLLLAIPVLTALTALGVMGGLSPPRRVIAASLVGMPYLAASFLAQSAFKETAMALLVLAFAVTLRDLAFLNRNPDYGGGSHPRRALIIVLLLLTASSVFVYSIPGLIWFALALPIWLVLELVTGGLRVDLAAAREVVRSHRRVILVVAIVVLAVAAFSASQLSGFVDKVGMVQASAGRLTSPVFPGEALGIWPQGDFRIVRGEVGGAYIAVAIALVAAVIGAVAAFRRRDWGLVAVGASAVIVYVGARLFASIYVEAKALAVMSPLVVLAMLLGLLAPDWSADDDAGQATASGAAGSGRWQRLRGRNLTVARYVFGAVVAACLALSALLALRAAPVGFDQRGKELEGLAGLIPNSPVVFFGVDRFSGYWLRGSLMKSPGGYVPSEVKARRSKVWQQGYAMDFDTVPPGTLDRFDYAITTRAGYQSSAPPNFKPVARTASFTLWKRDGHTPPQQIIEKHDKPGRTLACRRGADHGITAHRGSATVLVNPVGRKQSAWEPTWHFDAPGTATARMRLPRGRWDLSLQYDSQVSLSVSAGQDSFTLPPSLDGMYLSEQGKASFWRAGTVRSKGERVTVTVEAHEPSSFQRLAGVRRQVWLGDLAATRGGGQSLRLRDACKRYLDHYVVEGPAGGASKG